MLKIAEKTETNRDLLVLVDMRTGAGAPARDDRHRVRIREIRR